MSDTIVDGKVLTSDQEKLTGVGFNADGTGFISPLQIYISVETPEGTLFDIECLNKYRQPYVMYIYTDEFGDYTNAEGSGTNVVLGNVSGGFRWDSLLRQLLSPSLRITVQWQYLTENW